MLGKDKRLRHNKDFIRVLKQGKRHYNGGVLLYYRPNDLEYSRLGFIVGKKYSLLAVRRNKQRRIFQSVAKELYPQLNPGFDIIISYTNRDKVLPYKSAQRILKELFEQANLLF
ncbi:MAG: ribonuclease P protein component [Patescibacteria group bacterium]